VLQITPPGEDAIGIGHAIGIEQVLHLEFTLMAINFQGWIRCMQRMLLIALHLARSGVFCNRAARI
jgi:hypothetical protein